MVVRVSSPGGQSDEVSAGFNLTHFMITKNNMSYTFPHMVVIFSRTKEDNMEPMTICKSHNYFNCTNLSTCL